MAFCKDMHEEDYVQVAQQWDCTQMTAAYFLAFYLYLFCSIRGNIDMLLLLLLLLLGKM